MKSYEEYEIEIIQKYAESVSERIQLLSKELIIFMKVVEGSENLCKQEYVDKIRDMIKHLNQFDNDLFGE